MKPKTYTIYEHDSFVIDELTKDLLEVYIKHGCGHMLLRTFICFYYLIHCDTVDLTVQEFYNKARVDILDKENVSWD